MTLRRLQFVSAMTVLLLTWLDAGASMKTTLPKEVVMELIAEEAAAQDFPVDLALAVAQTESAFATLAVSERGARGVFQVMPRTGHDLYGLTPWQLLQPRTNIRAGIDFLGSLMDQYGSVRLALSHYNGGSLRKDASGRYVVTPATAGYVDTVLKRRARYDEWLQGPARERRQIAEARRWIIDDLRRILDENGGRARRLTGLTLPVGLRARTTSTGRRPHVR